MKILSTNAGLNDCGNKSAGPKPPALTECNSQCAGAPSPRAAFTLKELLVVLAVLAMLVLVCWPALGRARDRSAVAQCASNLRQMAMAASVYGNDYNDRLPFSNYANWLWDLAWGPGNLLNTYGAPWQVMYCPGTEARFSAANNYALYNYAPSSLHVLGYALSFPGNSSLATSNVNVSLTPQTIQAGPVILPPPLPSQRVLLADATLTSGGGNWSSIYGGFAVPHMSAHLAGSVPAGGNLAFLDLHVAWRPFSQMSPRTTAGASPAFYW